MNVSFRLATTEDLPVLKELFYNTIQEVCKEDYDQQQIKVWSSSVNNEERWQQLLTNQYVLLAEYQDQVVGFLTLENNNYIDFAYVHKDFQGQKIAQQLYEQLEARALGSNQSQLTSDVSITARSFFEKMGFEVIKQQKVERKGVKLTNFKMRKALTKQQKHVGEK